MAIGRNVNVVTGASEVRQNLLRLAQRVGKDEVSRALLEVSQYVIRRIIALAPDWHMKNQPSTPSTHRALRALLSKRAKDPTALIAGSHRMTPLLMWAEKGTYANRTDPLKKASRRPELRHRRGMPALRFFERGFNQTRGDILTLLTEKFKRMIFGAPVPDGNWHDNTGWRG